MAIYVMKSYWEEAPDKNITRHMFGNFPSEAEIRNVYPNLMFNYRSLVTTGRYVNPHTGFTIEIIKVYAL